VPYKEPQRKRGWEWRHRSQRLARRRELRQIEAARIRRGEPALLSNQVAISTQLLQMRAFDQSPVDMVVSARSADRVPPDSI
jgi:hypothetical protein